MTSIVENNKKIRDILDDNDRAALWSYNRIKELEQNEADLESELEEKESIEPDRPNKDEQGAKEFWVPFAEIPDQKMRSRGLYKNGKGHDLTSGLLWHFTAGRINQTGYPSSWGRGKGLSYMEVTRSGELWQAHPLNQWGYHGGKSRYELLFPNGKRRDVYSVSEYIVGMEMSNPGNLTRVGDWCYPWFNKSRSASQPRWRADECIQVTKSRDNIRPGWYLPMSAEQMATAFELSLWLKNNDPEGYFFENNIGHDECAWPRGRKPDPSATVWIDDPKRPASMPEIREHLKGLYK